MTETRTGKLTIRLNKADVSAAPTLAAVLRQALGNVPWSRARDLCRKGRVSVDGTRECDPAVRIERPCEIDVDETGPVRKAGVLERESILFVDTSVVVVRKAPFVLTLPFDATDRDTLVDQTRAALKRRNGRAKTYEPMLGVVQRLDKETSGVLVFARTLAAKKHLQQQFRVHSVERRYLALVHGHAKDATYDTLLLDDRGDGLRGSWGVFRRGRGRPPADAKPSVTHVEVLERYQATSLVACRLETGRQHQIRIHLSEAGHPLVGERVYIRDFRPPKVEARRVMLHASDLGFVHPVSGDLLKFSDEPPLDFQSCRDSLRAQQRN